MVVMCDGGGGGFRLNENAGEQGGLVGNNASV